MPNELKISCPRKKNVTATMVAVINDWSIIFIICFDSNPSVKLMKIGSTPIASTATKSGIKQSQKSFMFISSFSM